MPVTVPTANSTTKKVFAHYFPPYPVSFDNQTAAKDYYARNYLTVDGENGKHAAYGGLLRDRPAARSPLTGDWTAKDFTGEINSAKSSGIDGFLVDILSLSGPNWTRSVGLTNAAAAVGGFSVTPNIDVSGNLASQNPAAIADAIAPLMASPAANRLPDGRVALSSFKAEAKPASWWQVMFDRLKTGYGIQVAFTAVLLDPSEANMRAFAPISYVESYWGRRNPVDVQNTPNRTAFAHSLGVLWMEAVAVQDGRPNQAKYAEAANTGALRASWTKAIADGADMVQLVTWNDYSEGTSFAPSAAHGSAFLQLSSYYASWFKTGAAPSIQKDTVILTHRIQPYSAVPSVASRLMQPNLGSTTQAPRDTVEAVTLLTQPGTLTITVGGVATRVSVPAGLTSTIVPLAAGSVDATVQLSDRTTLDANSPYLVSAHPVVQDMQYYAVSDID